MDGIIHIIEINEIEQHLIQSFQQSVNLVLGKN